MSSLVLSIFPIVFFVLSADFVCAHPTGFPCCPGSQHVVALMKKHIGTFANAGEDESAVCATAKSAATQMKADLHSVDGCPSGGGNQIVEGIHEQLTKQQHLKMEITNEDECSYNLGFAHAMFEMAAAASGHAGNGAEWHKLTEEFNNESDAIGQLCQQFNIPIAPVRFSAPHSGRSEHKNVPSPSSVVNNPGMRSSANGQGMASDDDDM